MDFILLQNAPPYFHHPLHWQNKRRKRKKRDVRHWDSAWGLLCGAAVGCNKDLWGGKPRWHWPMWRVSGALSFRLSHAQLSPCCSPRGMCCVCSILQLSMCVLVTTSKWCAAPGLTSRKHSSSWSCGRKWWNNNSTAAGRTGDTYTKQDFCVRLLTRYLTERTVIVLRSVLSRHWCCWLWWFIGRNCQNQCRTGRDGTKDNQSLTERIDLWSTGG